MDHIKEFNTRLNRSVSMGQVNDSTYLNQINTMLRRTLEGKSSLQQACLIGAGRCRDISLTLFLDAFDSVIVTDVDHNSLKECAKDRRRLTVKEVEYTGFGDAKFFESFGARMWAAKTTEDIDAYIDDTIQAVSEYQFLPELFGQMDLVFVSPIYTQLIYQQCVNEVMGLRQDGYPSDLADYIEQRMLLEMPGIIERFNTNLIRLLNKDGILFVLSDIFELQEGTDFHRKVIHSIRDTVVMDEIYQTYRRQYGLGLGDYGLVDLTNHVSLQKQRWLLWKFAPQRSYAVQLHIYQNSNAGGNK